MQVSSRTKFDRVGPRKVEELLEETQELTVSRVLGPKDISSTRCICWSRPKSTFLFPPTELLTGSLPPRIFQTWPSRMAHALNAQTKEIGNWSIIYDALMSVPEIEYIIEQST